MPCLRCAPLILIALLESACGDGAQDGTRQGAAASATTATAEWVVDATPRLVVGDREDGDSAVFGRISDARLLPSGVLAVADAGAFSVKFFGADGALLNRVGRRGKGPDEFTGAMSLMDAPGDSVAVWDAGQSRWTFLATAGSGRQLAAALPLPVWMRAGIEVHSALPAPSAWVLAQLDSLGAASDAPQVAQLDVTGLLWVREATQPHRWLAYAGVGAPVGAVALPVGFSALHFAAEGIVAVEHDTLGFERVVVLGLRRGPHPPPAREPVATPAADAALRDSLAAVLRKTVMAQEMYWMTAQGYASSVDSLTLDMPSGIRVKVLEANKRGWRGLGWHRASGTTCGMIVGMAPPAGWSEGEVVCTAFR